MQYHWCCFFDSLVAKDCQYPRDPMQPAIKKTSPSHCPLNGPACHCGRSRLSTNFPNSLPSHPILIHQSFPPLRPDLSLWQVPPHPTSSSPSLPLLSLPGFHILMHRTRLATVASLTFPPASPLIPPSSSYLLPPIPIIPARLVIVAGQPVLRGRQATAPSTPW